MKKTESEGYHLRIKAHAKDEKSSEHGIPSEQVFYTVSAKQW